MRSVLNTLYIKATDDADHTLALIPGAFYGAADAHAFVIALDGDGVAARFDFPLRELQASPDRFDAAL